MNDRHMVSACDTLRLACSVTVQNDTNFGDVDEETRTGSGVVGSIQRGVFDTSVPYFTPTYISEPQSNRLQRRFLLWQVYSNYENT